MGGVEKLLQAFLLTLAILVGSAIVYFVLTSGSSETDSDTDYGTEFVPDDSTDPAVEREIACLEAAYDRYEANPMAYPGYSNELEYANALCDE